MNLRQLLKLQLIYCMIGATFNLISWLMFMTMGKALTPTSPIAGLLVMGAFSLFLLAGKYQKIILYRVLMGLAVVTLINGGIYKHIQLLNESPSLYYSPLVGIIAILINVFGFLLFAYAALGLFQNGIRKQS